MSDGFLISLQCPAHGALRTPTKSTQNLPRMAFVVFDSGLLLNERSHTPDGPQGSGITVSFRAFDQRRFDSIFLRLRKSRQTSGTTGLAQSVFALFFESRSPTADRLPVNSEPARHFGLVNTSSQQFVGGKASLFQCVEIAFYTSCISHALRIPASARNVTIKRDSQ